MADQEHFEILKQGVTVWNEWREEHRNARIELKRADFSGADLSGAQLEEADFTNADLRGVHLNKANLREADLGEADLTEADLRGAMLDRASLVDAHLSRAKLREAQLDGAFLVRADLSHADLSEAHLSRAYLSDAQINGAKLKRAFLYRADLTWSQLRSADLREAHLGEADLSGADLSGADLREAHLGEADLSGANLSGANLSGAYLGRADLGEADLGGADLSSARLDGADFSGAYLREADFSGAEAMATVFGNLDLRFVKGLETLHHKGPSTIGIDTLERSQGEIPEVFLREAGVSETFLEYARAFVNNPLHYPSCCISFSSEDQSFAEKLYADLRAEGVRCWFAPEELRYGSMRVKPSIEAKRLYDKLLLILSEHSVVNQRKLAEAAMEWERKEHRLLLFPLRLDDTIMEIDQDWPPLILKTRPIGDFTGWEHDDQYQKAFARLLNDLKDEKLSR